MVWIDTETFGLERDDPMLELGMRVTDTDLNLIDQKSALLWSSKHQVSLDLLKHSGRDSDKWVLKQHTHSGLFEEARVSGLYYLAAQEAFVDWIESVFRAFDGGKLSDQPLCGSTVHFDRKVLGRWMPEFMEMFHYRNIDISTLKELCKRRSPDLFKKQDLRPKKAHRVLPDLDDTIEEAQWYFDNFLF